MVFVITTFYGHKVLIFVCGAPSVDALSDYFPDRCRSQIPTAADRCDCPFGLSFNRRSGDIFFVVLFQLIILMKLI